MRFERKYKIQVLDKRHVEANVRVHPAGFRKIYPDRRVNNIYFDTINLRAFNENLDGVNQRKKFRLRWYGEDMQDLKNLKFEKKIKHNELGKKEVSTFPDATFDELGRLTELVNDQSGNMAPLVPVLMNSYQRSYWGTPDGLFRVTIDWELQYHSLLSSRHFSGYVIEDPEVILEIKYNRPFDDHAAFVFQNFPFRHTKSSKYVTGVLLSSGM